MKYIETTYFKKTKKRKGENRGKVVSEQHRYQTKKLTRVHIELLDKYPTAVTCLCDTSVQWAFGTFATCIGRSGNTETEVRDQERLARTA